MTDDLARWAAERAPHLLVRAEAEAVALLREALVAAATGEPARAEEVAATAAPAAAPASEAKPAPGPKAAEPGELLWAYGVLRAGDPYRPDIEGVHERDSVSRVEAAGLAALVSRVPRAHFGAEPLRRNLNDIAWLERVARAHEAVLEQAVGRSTIVPLRLCTIYESEEGVRRALERGQDVFAAALDALAGRQEWGVKVLVDPAKLAWEARTRSDEAGRLERELDSHGGGGAYMLRRRLERYVREASDAIARELAEQVHARFQDWSIDAVTRPPQNRDLSRHEGEMLLNAAYLVEADRVDGLRQLASELEARHSSLGARIELTGPWPPYNFVPGGGAEGLT